MRRGFLRLRSLSAHNRGLIQLGYLRELGFVAFLMSAVLLVQQSFRAPAAPSVDNKHAEQPVYGLTMSESGKTLWIARERYGITNVTLADGAERDRWMLFQSEASFAAHGGAAEPLTLRFGLDRSVELLRGTESIHYEMLSEDFTNMSDTDVSMNGRVAVVVSGAGLMKVWTLNDCDEVVSQRFAVPDQLDHVAISPDGKTIAMVNWQSVFLWNREESRIATSWEVNHGAAPTRVANRADTLAWSPDNTHFALGLDDGMVRIWNVADRSLSWEHHADKYKLTALAFSESGTSLATGGFDKHVRVWNLEDKKLLWERTLHTRPVHNLTFAANDSRLFSGGLDGKVCEWSADHGQFLRELP